MSYSVRIPLVPTPIIEHLPCDCCACVDLITVQLQCPPRPRLSAAIDRTVIWISLACRLLTSPVPKVRYTSHNRLYDASGWHPYWLLHFRQDLIMLVLRFSHWVKSGFRSCGVWRWVIGWGVTRRFEGTYLHPGVQHTKSNHSPENEDNAFFRNVGNLSPNDSASHFVRPQS